MSQNDHIAEQPDDELQRAASWREFPFLLLKGFLMGSADIIPGVSGGTMALILGIYSRLLHAIKSFDLFFFKRLFTFKLKKALNSSQWKFMVMLLSGIFLAVFFFTKIVPLQVYMFTDPELIFGLFFGLIIGSIFILAKELESFSWWHVLFIIMGSIIGFWVVTLVPAETPESSFFVFLSGSVAICAMILPGISGSYILLILRKYDFILSQLGKLGTANTLEGLKVMIPFVLGAMIGLVSFSRLLAWLLDFHYKRTLAVLIGFLIGSLYVIWPYQNRSYQTFVIKQKVIDYISPLAEQLRKNPPDKNQPEYQRLGKIINEDASFDELKQIELLTVKKKLIHSEPYIPYVTVDGAGTQRLLSGIAAIIIGMCLVAGLDFLRKKT